MAICGSVAAAAFSLALEWSTRMAVERARECLGVRNDEDGGEVLLICFAADTWNMRHVGTRREEGERERELRGSCR